jgi:hypothetical protein
MGVQYNETIDRMRWAGKLKNDSAIARALGVTPQAFSSYKKRGSIPSDLILKFASMIGLSVDWLITGDGEMYKQGKAATGAQGAAETTSQYGTSERTGRGSTISADEMIYVGKLLKVLRSNNIESVTAVKTTIDSYVTTTEAAMAANYR